MGRYKGIKEKIADGGLIRDHTLRALELTPDDAGLNHIMGRWCYEVAGISWVQRQIAATIFGEPPSSSFEQALEYFVRADTLTGAKGTPWKMNKVYKGKCEMKLGRRAQAATSLEQAVAIPSNSAEDRAAQRKAEAELAKL